MRTLNYSILWFVGAAVACQNKPERSWCGDGECAEGENSESCPSDCAEDEDSGSNPSDYSKDGESEDSADDNGMECPTGIGYKGDQLENPRNKCEARAACNHIGTCSNGGNCLRASVSRGTVEGLIHPSPSQACGRYLGLNAMVVPVSGELVLQIEKGEVTIAIFADWDRCRPVGEFPCDAGTVAMAEVTAGTVVYWFVAGGDGSEYEIGVGGGEEVFYTLRWEIRK